MSADLVWKNLVQYCLQIGLLVGLAAFVPTVLRLRLPRAKLVYWQILLLACLVLPLVQTWRQEVIQSQVEVASVITAIAPQGAPSERRIPMSQIALGLLAAGAVARLGWLAAGFWRLWLYRRRSRPARVATPWETRAEIRISTDVTSPVTFGVRDPVVLVPTQFPEMNERTQNAILCHELLHVERRDWLFTVGEELVRSVFWFHPAIWWLLGEIQLAREQAVDRQVIDITQAREEYLDALLAIAGAKPQLDLAPAPLFLRKRHLKERVVSLMKEARMSRARLASALAAGLGILAVSCWFASMTFPLSASPQVVSDAAGVTLDLGGAVLLHRTGIDYPAPARKRGVQGAVTIEVTIDGVGNVSDARVLSGPEELRKAALESVLGWHFAREGPGSRRMLTVSFRLGAAEPVSLSEPAPEPVRQASPARERTRPSLIQTVRSIAITGLPDGVRSELLSRLPVQEGAPVAPSPDLLEKISASVREFDEHLKVTITPVPGGGIAVVISAPQERVPERIKVGGNAQQARLIQQPKPIYPPAAKEARIQGVVKLSAVIGKDGTVQQLEVMSGHPLLVASAIHAVKNWVYQVTTLNGTPVEVITQIDVNYTLSQ